MNNLLCVLTLYRDQLDAQTHDQVICILIYIIYSHIHNNDSFSHIDIEVNCRCYGSHTSENRLPVYLIYVLLIKRFGGQCHHLSALRL